MVAAPGAAAAAGVVVVVVAAGASGGRPAVRDFFFFCPPPEVPRLLRPVYARAGSGKAVPAKPSRCATSRAVRLGFPWSIAKMLLIVPNTLGKGVPYTEW